MKSIQDALQTFIVKFDCKLESPVTFTGKVDSSPKESPLFFAQSTTDETKFYNILYKKEKKEKFVNLSNFSNINLLKDNLGRYHLSTPYSGDAYVKLRSSKYNPTTIATHVTDLYGILKPFVDEKSVYMFLADGGPDFNPSHLANELFYYRLFKLLNADILAVMTYAARYSAFNPIEHLWSPLSNKLAGVIFSASSDGDLKAPAQQSGLSNDERKEKEKKVFDRAMLDIENNFWKNASFDSFSVESDVIKCNEDELLFNDFERVKQCLKSPLRNLSEFKDIVCEYKKMFLHIDRHLNEIIFVKCNDKSCCGDFRADRVKEYFGGKVEFPSPSFSKVYKEHYNTFLQESLNKDTKKGDYGQPTAERKQLGQCDICPAFSFKSTTEKQRHMSMFHRYKPNLPVKEKIHICKFEGCNKSFASQPSLSRHQKENFHRARDVGNSKIEKQQKKRKGVSINEALRKASGKRKRDQDDENEKGDEGCSAAFCVPDSTSSKQEMWVSCGICLEWFHSRCVGLGEKTEAELNEQDFFCDKCSQQ